MTGIRAVMFFVDDPESTAAWCSRHFAQGQVMVEAGGFAWFELAGIEIGFHSADPTKNMAGGAPVVYIAVEDVDSALSALLADGCVLWRGPLEVREGRRICQFRDPFGLIWGLDGG